MKIKILIKKNIKIYLHTNQSGVGRGYFGISDVVDCNNKMIELIGLGQNIFQEICVAPDFPPSKVSYRKPSSLFANELIKNMRFRKKIFIQYEIQFQI